MLIYFLSLFVSLLIPESTKSSSLSDGGGVRSSTYLDCRAQIFAPTREGNPQMRPVL
jgi:hypothetical protein